MNPTKIMGWAFIVTSALFVMRIPLSIVLFGPVFILGLLLLGNGGALRKNVEAGERLRSRQ